MGFTPMNLFNFESTVFEKKKGACVCVEHADLYLVVISPVIENHNFHCSYIVSGISTVEMT